MNRIPATCFFILILMMVVISSCSEVYKTYDLNIRNRVFNVELALSSRQKSKGLMYREKIPENGGMLFIYKSPREHVYWMKNCLADIDLAFIDASGTVVAMYEMKTEPPRTSTESEEDYIRRLKTYPSNVPVIFALELQSGTFKELGLSVGEKLSLPIAELQAMVK